jgi:hypothetical protein
VDLLSFSSSSPPPLPYLPLFELGSSGGLGRGKLARVWLGRLREDGGDPRRPCHGHMAWILRGPRLWFGRERKAWWPTGGGAAAGVMRARQRGRCVALARSKGGEALGAGARAGGGGEGAGCGAAGGGRRESRRVGLGWQRQLRGRRRVARRARAIGAASWAGPRRVGCAHRGKGERGK